MRTISGMGSMGMMGRMMVMVTAIAVTAVAGAQTNAPAVTLNETNGITAPGMTLNPGAAQAAGQQFLDNVPIFNVLTNLPTTTFMASTFELFVGLQNTGSEINNSIAGHYNIHTNFFVEGQVTLGAVPNVVNSLGIGGGLRHAWAATEVYGGLAGVRNFNPGVDTWQGEGFAGIAWKPSSGFSLFGQVETFISQVSKAPPMGFETGINFPF